MIPRFYRGRAPMAAVTLTLAAVFIAATDPPIPLVRKAMIGDKGSLF